MISHHWLSLMAATVLLTTVWTVPVPANSNNGNGNADNPEYGSTNGMDKRLSALFDALPDSADTNTFKLLNLSAPIDDKNTTLGQLFNTYPELLVSN